MKGFVDYEQGDLLDAADEAGTTGTEGMTAVPSRAAVAAHPDALAAHQGPADRSRGRARAGCEVSHAAQQKSN